ncbi:PD-(D/E)XK nuclease family protein [Kamptonema cortianum]|nr:PD-(D/E)XK nuclease family protein [Oscillatoria laete-virens]MDK3159603.1 PD-(D/E)XK nuclease family protein [Kamptonema cortianum]MDL5048648.1 PD-(D/E)XK nuclease family protein [Oscillatoria amoena NRMC-F 0135]MDL5053260.1 PD-(D/E)XK nuclease family protein [Oscillatoria laete-virens NRMC-F 0139]
MARQKKTQEPGGTEVTFEQILAGIAVDHPSPDPSLKSGEKQSEIPATLTREQIAPIDPEQLARIQTRFALDRTALKPSEHSAEEAIQRYASIETDPTVATTAALDYGNWWHHTMEFMPWRSGPEQMARYVREALGKIRGTPLEARATPELEQFARSSLHAELTHGDMVCVGAEIPFTRRAEADGVQDGVVDLVAIDRHGQVSVVDWKTDFFGGQKEPSAEAIEQATQYYAGQLQTYRRTWEEHGCTVDRVMIYFTALGRVVAL